MKIKDPKELTGEILHWEKGNFTGNLSAKGNQYAYLIRWLAAYNRYELLAGGTDGHFLSRVADFNKLESAKKVAQLLDNG